MCVCMSVHRSIHFIRVCIYIYMMIIIIIISSDEIHILKRYSDHVRVIPRDASFQTTNIMKGASIIKVPVQKCRRSCACNTIFTGNHLPKDTPPSNLHKDVLYIITFTPWGDFTVSTINETHGNVHRLYSYSMGIKQRQVLI